MRVFSPSSTKLLTGEGSLVCHTTCICEYTHETSHRTCARAHCPLPHNQLHTDTSSHSPHRAPTIYLHPHARAYPTHGHLHTACSCTLLPPPSHASSSTHLPGPAHTQTRVPTGLTQRLGSAQHEAPGDTPSEVLSTHGGAQNLGGHGHSGWALPCR